MNQLDQNLVATQWGLIGAFGVAVTLLLPKAEAFRRSYIEGGGTDDYEDARRWRRIVLVVPSIVLLAVTLLSLLGFYQTQAAQQDQRLEQIVLLIVPILAQCGFLLVAAQLAHSVSARVINLTPIEGELPRSTDSRRSASIVFENETPYDLVIWWIDESGSPALHGDGNAARVGAGGKHAFQSWSGHQFLVTTEAKDWIGTAAAVETPTLVRISAEDLADARRRKQQNA